MRHKKNHPIFKALFLAAGLFLPVPRGWTLAITPTIQNFELAPGESVEGEVLIANTEAESVSISPVSKNWFVLPANKKFKVEDWLTVDQEVFTLNGGESRKVRFKAKAPKKAQGELVGMISFKTKSATMSTVEFVLSGAVYVAVKGTEKFEGDIRAMMVMPSSESVKAGVLLRNTGNVHLRPIGIFKIFDDNDQPVANVELEVGQPTYPGNLRSYLGEVKDLRMKPGKYVAHIDLVDRDRGAVIDRQKQKFLLMEDFKVKF